jgi:hypothetical protein
MRKINRKTADPEILQAYEELRYERRYPKLEIMAYAIRALGYAGVLPVFFIPEGARLPYIKVWMVFAAVAIIMEFSLMVFWQPRGRRMKAFLIIIAVIGTAALMVAGFIFGMGLLLD